MELNTGKAIAYLDYYIRQSGIIDVQLLTKSILIVGAGSIGSWTALALLKLGCSDITIIDNDVVEVHNAGSQVYNSLDDGEKKIDALSKKLMFLTEIQPTTEELTITAENAKTCLKGFDIIISAIDNIEGRTIMFEALKDTEKLFIDGRMAGNAIEIYTIPMSDPEKVKLYQDTLFTPEEAIEVPCSERSVVYNCFVIAGLITDIVAQNAKGTEVPEELIVDLQNFTMFK